MFNIVIVSVPFGTVPCPKFKKKRTKKTTYKEEAKFTLALQF